ncbi:nuclear transcription factor Y subunit C-2 [Ricinus communis]|uniref:Ccaat-binding transcription factor, putative n=1 Tax=Ricinus communis TaxID=3988 RepID=B9RHZ1_RICCO|nr:nuclear transcription factor Y subunit C-2 [Ricinus communis]XP_015571158.1 nuclear transcription factor Y subunit C-2 [Ricinus communis]XP_048228813.1 nuclear transcription factor Y subunit C-2 [Ricinus communis]EEF48763.1 ccaat-binding transcription factor, putative [Ricinus communis]|eukprot:XP_002513360.1 nuclear transcription factor Y subunit C-2 [Ricinus communis]
MDQSEQGQQQQQQSQQPVMGVVAGAGQMAYSTAPYQTTAMMASGAPAIAVPSPTQPPSSFSNSPHQLTYQQAQHFHHQQQQQQQQQLQMFWANQMQEIEQTMDFKNHSLPLARIKKIMKADEDVRMISAEAPVIFAKACEMFILELTLRSWIHTEENKRRTLQKNDIAAAISRTDVFDFLVDIIPRDELKEEGLGVTKATIPMVGSPADMPYYYVPPQHPVGPPGMIMGKPVDQAAGYGGQQQPRPPMAFMPWPQTQPQQQQQQPQQQQSDT